MPKGKINPIGKKSGIINSIINRNFLIKNQNTKNRKINQCRTLLINHPKNQANPPKNQANPLRSQVNSQTDRVQNRRNLKNQIVQRSLQKNQGSQTNLNGQDQNLQKNVKDETLIVISR